MINVIRKNQQALMIIVTVLVIISFVFFYNINRNTSRTGPDRVGTIYNRPLTQVEFERGVGRLYVAAGLGLNDLVQVLVQPQSNDRNLAPQNFSLNSIILRHEADQLLVNPTDDEIKNAEGNLRVFQTDGKIDAGKLNAFVTKVLPSRGFASGAVIDELVADDLRLQKLRKLIGSPLDVTPAEVRSAYVQQFQKAQVELLRFDLSDMLAGVTVSDEEVQKAFDGKKDGYKSDEKRKIAFVKFALSDAEAKLKDTDRMEALQKLANKVNDFMQAAADSTVKFEEVAAKFNTPVSETSQFTEHTPDPAFESIPGAAEAAFKTTPASPNEVVQAGNDFYILHLEEVVPSRALGLTEAKPKIVEQLKNDRAREKISVTAGIIRGVITAALKDGKSIDDIAKEQHLKVDRIPAFSISDYTRETPTEMQAVMQKSMELTEGQFSEFIPTADGGFIIYLEKRLPVDEAKFEEMKAKISEELLANKQTFALLEWMRLRRDAAKIH